MGRAEQEAHTEVLGITYTTIAVCLAVPAIIVLFMVGQPVVAWVLILAELAHITMGVARYFAIPPDLRKRDKWALR